MGNSGELLLAVERLVEQRNVLGAIEAAKRLLDSSDDEVDLVKCGKLLEKVQETNFAKQTYEKAVALSPEFSLAHSALGLLALGEGDNEQAIAHFSEAVRLEPDDAGKLTLLGVAYIDSGKVEVGSDWLRRALKLDPTYQEANYNLGFALRDTDPRQAQLYFSKALEADPECSLAHRELGWLLAKASPGPEAEYQLRRAIELNPTDAWAHVYLGHYLWDQGEADAAVQEFRKGVVADAASAFPLRALAGVYEARQEWQQAENLYERALKLEPDNIVVNMSLGRMMQKKGDRKLARIYLERALFLDPEYDAARDLLNQLFDR